MKALDRIRGWFKTAPFPASGRGANESAFDLAMDLTSLLRPTRQRLNYAAVEPVGSSVFAACLSSYTSVVPSIPVTVERETDDGWDAVPEHPLSVLLAHSNPVMTTAQFWSATLLDWWVYGNSFWAVERNGRGAPVAMWPIPAPTIRPRWPSDGSAWISHYDQRVDDRVYRVETSDVVHFRCGIDYSRRSLGRCGRSPIESIRSLIFVDDEADAFTATILANLGVPGVIFTPKGEMTLSPQARTDFVATYQEATSGGKRGRAILFHTAMELQRLGFSPKEINFAEITSHIESRVAAVMNVPAAVAGLRVGLEAASQRANYVEAQRQFYENGVIPLARQFADVLTAQLLPQFGAPGTSRVAFDFSGVAALLEDVDAVRARNRADFIAGILTRNEVRTAAGFEPDPRGDVYLVPASVVPVPWGQDMPAPAVAAAPAIAAPKRLRLLKAADDDEPLSSEDNEALDEARAMLVRLGSPLLLELFDAQPLPDEAEKQTHGALGWLLKGVWYEPRLGRYVDDHGRMVTGIREELDGVADGLGLEMRGMAERFTAGEINEAEYVLGMRTKIREAHTGALALAKGGRAQVTTRDMQRLGATLRQEYQYLNLRIGQFNTEGASAAQLVGSVDGYAQKMRATYENERGRIEAETKDLERWIRHASDSCPGCIEQEARGWVAIGELPQIGSQQCRSSCRCSKSYRKEGDDV